LTSWNNLPGDYGAWSGISVFTYLLFPSNSDVKAVEKKMQAMFDTYIRPIVPPESNLRVEFVLEPLIRIHLYSTTPDEPEPTGSISFVYIFSLVALFLVLISSINYINLATARSSRRANEVSIRKVVGSGRGQLIVQFLSESVVLTLVSLVLSIIIVIIFLPDFNMLCSKSFDLHVIFSRAILLVLFGIMLMVSILGGSFPAFVLSGFTPVSVLKSDATLSLPGGLLRKILVVFQFAVSVLMIICTLVISRQLKFLQTMDRGFDENNVIALQLNGLMNQKYPVLKQYLLENPDIKYVTSTDSPVGSGSGKSYFNVETDQGMSQKIINCAVVDYDFIKTLGIKIIKGRDFQQDMLSDTLAGVIVNETFVNQMGWSEPIGKKVETGNFNGISARVIGVMHDYHQAGMYNETGSFILINRIRNSIVYLKLRGNNVQETLDYINKRWTEVFPGETFTYTFLTDRFNMQFEADERRGHIFTLFTLLAIIIACLGLFGLVSYTVEQRTKEIGIRKVFGAHEGSILKLILKDFLLLVSIGIIIAVPVAYYLMSQWLQKYVYRTGIGMAVIATSALLTVLITFFTIIYKAYMASVINPADSIRTE
jgi:putative ABC transport system permease protein